jgi:hypothetical protein
MARRNTTLPDCLVVLAAIGTLVVVWLGLVVVFSFGGAA